MLENTPELQKLISNSLTQFYGINANTLTLIEKGADANALVYKSGEFFIKVIKGKHKSINLDVMELLKASSLKHIIFPIKTLDGKSIQYLEEFTLIVYPFIEGQDGFSQTLTAEQWQALGNELRKLHEIKVPDSLQKKLRHETYSAKFRDDVSTLYNQLDTIIATDNIALEFIDSLKKNSETVHKLISRAGELAQILKDTPAQFILCHTDIHGGNVLIDKDNAIYIVDWDAPMMAPKERDLMFIGGGVSNVWNKPEEEILFYKGYGHTEVNKAILSYYRHERIVQDISEFAESILYSESSAASKIENYNHFKAMFAPNGVIDIAFRNDEH
jgi:spectinomycin phosphotransferase